MQDREHEREKILQGITLVQCSTRLGQQQNSQNKLEKMILEECLENTVQPAGTGSRTIFAPGNVEKEYHTMSTNATQCCKQGHLREGQTKMKSQRYPEESMF